MKYDIISVDWNPGQTDLWLHYVKKNCPEAYVTLIPDEKPVPWHWAAGKINCFKQVFETDCVIYLDTDTIVTCDLSFVFDELGGRILGAATSPSVCPYYKRRGISQSLRPLADNLGIKDMPGHYNSGFIVTRMHKDDLPSFAAAWEEMHHTVKKYIGKDHYMDEIALSFLIEAIGEQWDIPPEIHGNVCGRKIFGTSNKPAVIHYHKTERLGKFGLGEYLCIEK